MYSVGVILFLALFAGCSGHPKKVHDTPASETMTPAAEEAQTQPQEIAEITFSKGKSKLGTKAKQKLQAVLDKVERKGTISKIKAITWGDLEYPSVFNSKDLDRDITLVVKRNYELGNYLQEIVRDINIETFNMAEREIAINKLATDENIKKSLETAGIPNTDTSVKVPGKASKSIVIFIMEEE